MKTQDLIDLANSSVLDRNTFESILFSDRRQGIKILADREDISVIWRFEAIEHRFGPNYSSSRLLSLIDELLKKTNLPKNESKFLEEKKSQIELKVFKGKYGGIKNASLVKRLAFLQREFEVSMNTLIKKEIFLQKLTAMRDDSFAFDSEEMKRARLLVENLDSEIFSEHRTFNRQVPQVSNSFSDGKYQHDIIHVALIVCHLLRSERIDSQVCEQNSILLSQAIEIFGSDFRVYDNRIVNWPAPAFASFVLLLPWDSNTSPVSKNLFSALTSFVRGLGDDVEDSAREAIQRREAKEIQAKENKERAIEQSRRAEEQKRIAESKREEQKKQREENEKLERDYQKLVQEILRRFPWSVPTSNIHPSRLHMLESRGFEVHEGRIFLKREESSFSIFEKHGIQFPHEKEFLVSKIQDFMRFVDHKKRYLIDVIYLELKFPFGIIRLRVDQVAMIREKNQLFGCWAITIFGIPLTLVEKIYDQGWRPISTSNFFPKSDLTSEEISALDSVYFAKKRTEEGARSSIGKLIEMLEFDLDLNASEARIEVVRLSAEEERRRETLFKQALQRTFWKGERTTGSGLHHCLECGREIWDAPSLARGFGPDCWDKIRYTELGYAVLSTSGRDSRFDEKRDALAVDLRTWISGISRDFIRFYGQR